MTIVPGRGIGVDLTCQVLFATNSVVRSLQTVGLNLSMDGTNWPNTNSITIVFPLALTNKTEFYTNIPASMCDSARAARLETWNNADTTNAVTVQRILLGHAQETYPTFIIPN